MWLHGLSFYDLIKMYSVGIFEGALSYHASAVAFSFFMALFPFALFILNLIPFIPIEGFQTDFLEFVKDGVPPNTYDAIFSIINDILNNSHSGLLSTGFFLSIFLMAKFENLNYNYALNLETTSDIDILNLDMGFVLMI